MRETAGSTRFASAIGARPTPGKPAAGAARAWRTVLERVETDLLEGRLGPGDRLASERDLAAELGVGRSSVREALRVLEVMGLIRTGTGSGPAAGAIITATPSGGMSALLRLQVAAQSFPFDDVVRTRLILETAVVESLAASVPDGVPAGLGAGDALAGRAAGDALAGRAAGDALAGRAAGDALAGRAAGDALAGRAAGDAPAGRAAEDTPLTRTADARAIADAMDTDGLTSAEFLALDAQLHLALAEASGNVVVAAMMAGLRSSIESYVQAGAARIADWDATSRRLRIEHRSILDAIDARHPTRASALVRDHILTYYAEAGPVPTST